MRAVICVGWRPGVASRERLWNDIVRPHLAAMPWPIYTGNSDPERPYNWSGARNAAARAAGDWDVAAFLDADVKVPQAQLRDAFDLAHATGEAVIPFTDQLLVSMDGQTLIAFSDEQPVDALSIGGRPHIITGNVVIPRKAWNAVGGGWDESFTEYGFEDWAMLAALNGLAGLVRLPGFITRYDHERREDEHQDVPKDMPVGLPDYVEGNLHADRSRLSLAVDNARIARGEPSLRTVDPETGGWMLGTTPSGFTAPSYWGFRDRNPLRMARG